MSVLCPKDVILVNHYCGTRELSLKSNMVRHLKASLASVPPPPPRHFWHFPNGGDPTLVFELWESLGSGGKAYVGSFVGSKKTGEKFFQKSGVLSVVCGGLDSSDGRLGPAHFKRPWEVTPLTFILKRGSTVCADLRCWSHSDKSL